MSDLTLAAVEKDLVIQSQNGDRSAYEELVRAHYPVIISVVYRMCGDMELAQDAAQETFLRAWLNLSSYHPESPLRSWLCRIALNAAVDMLRRRKEIPMEEETLQDLPAPRELDPEATLIHKEQAAFLGKAVSALPEAARSVLVLREYGDLSYHEIALALDIPIGTVMSRLNYARSRLRDMLKTERQLLEAEYA